MTVSIFRHCWLVKVYARAPLVAAPMTLPIKMDLLRPFLHLLVQKKVFSLVVLILLLFLFFDCLISFVYCLYYTYLF